MKRLELQIVLKKKKKRLLLNFETSYMPAVSKIIIK